MWKYVETLHCNVSTKFATSLQNLQRLYKICNVSTKFATSLQNLQRLYKICNVSTKFATSLQNRWGSHEIYQNLKVVRIVPMTTSGLSLVWLGAINQITPGVIEILSLS
ncbi:hypothetical protein FIS3754_26820 [Fischerella sp. NIES-3754]|nr:hypothetical protein FIS3754_26820 [Fischerella sp. NIES-3754]